MDVNFKQSVTVSYFEYDWMHMPLWGDVPHLSILTLLHYSIVHWNSLLLWLGVTSSCLPLLLSWQCAGTVAEAEMTYLHLAAKSISEDYRDQVWLEYRRLEQQHYEKGTILHNYHHDNFSIMFLNIYHADVFKYFSQIFIWLIVFIVPQHTHCYWGTKKIQ